MAIGSISHAYALTTLPASNGSFAISQSKVYYLKGSFNDWSANNEYIFNDVTSTMIPEENKINEYSISKTLSKGATLKVWDSDNNWYTQGVDNCSYDDKWGRSTDNNADYVVPMTATYSIYLKFYSTGATQVYLTAPDFETIYLKPNSNWLSDNARFAAYFFNNSGNEWHDLIPDGDYYGITIPEGYNKVIFCRMSSSATDNNWSNVWNQTEDLHFDKTSYLNALEIPDDSWTASNSDWGSK